MAKAKKERKDWYSEFTGTMVSMLEEVLAKVEAGETKWVCPWDKTMDVPRNGSTNRCYNGINILFTLIQQWKKGYGDCRWYTYKQASELNGGKGGVRKGEKGTKIVFWSFPKRKVQDEKTDAAGNVTQTERFKTIPLLGSWTVFNHEQIEWAEGCEPQLKIRCTEDPAERYAEVEALVDALNPDLKHGGSRACYSPSQDKITMPRPATFNSTEDYLSTKLHELAHWTGHATRLDRSLDKGRFGDETYAMEELVAELASALLCAELGVKGKMQHTEYLGHWLKVLKADKYALFTAAKAAQKATEYILKGGKVEEVAIAA